jgi:hypothetical protein
MKNTLNKSQKQVFVYIILLLISFNTYAQCVLIERVQYNADNKKTAQQNNTFDKKGNLLERTQTGTNIYQSQLLYSYDAQNKVIKTTTKLGDKIAKVDSSTFIGKETKTNSLGEKSSEETVLIANNKVKTTKDKQGNIIATETTQYQGGKLILKEIRNAENQIVSRETVELNDNQNPVSIVLFDGISNQTNKENFIYNANNQIIKIEKLIDNALQTFSIFSHQKNKVIRKENFDKKEQLIYYQTFTYLNNTQTETIFYEGILHSKIITTFDKQNNPVEIQNFNEKQKLTSKTINVFECTQKL